MISRAKMCLNKVSFRSRGKAEAVALRFGQRVYECPICFCWHCTNKENWRDEFVDAEETRQKIAGLERKIISLENKIRAEYNIVLREKNKEINALKQEVYYLRKRKGIPENKD